MFQRVLDTFEILDSAYASGKAVQDLFASKGFGDIVEVQQLNGPKGTTDFVRIIIKGSNGKLSGGTAPTLGVTGRLGGLGARPEMIGFVSDGDGALTAIAVALKLYKSDLHDRESEVITINRITRAYSPWNSKIHGLTQLPTRKK